MKVPSGSDGGWSKITAYGRRTGLFRAFALYRESELVPVGAIEAKAIV